MSNRIADSVGKFAQLDEERDAAKKEARKAKLLACPDLAETQTRVEEARVAATNLRLITLGQIPERFGLNESRHTINRWIKSGRFPKPHRIPGGHHLYFFEHEILEWLEAMPEAGPLRRRRKKSTSSEGGK